MFFIDLPKEPEKQLEKMAKKLQLSKAYCVQQAIVAYLDCMEKELASPALLEKTAL